VKGFWGGHGEQGSEENEETRKAHLNQELPKRVAIWGRGRKSKGSWQMTGKKKHQHGKENPHHGRYIRRAIWTA